MKRNSYILLVILLVLTFWKFFIPGPKVANDFPYIFSDSLKESFQLPSTWISKGGEGMGEPGVLTMWSWPIDFLYGLGGKIGISFEILEKFLGALLVIVLGVLSIQKLLNKFGVKGEAAFVASLFYLTSSYMILLIDGGQLQIAIAYSFFPLVFVWMSEGIEGGLKNKIIGGLGISLLGFLDIRFVYVFLLLLAIWVFYNSLFLRKENVLSWVKNVITSGLVSLFVFVGLHFYWILPLVMGRGASLNSNLTRLTQVTSLGFTNIGHALFLLQPHWFKNVFGKITQLRVEFIIIPILAFLAPVLKRSKNVGFWLFVALIGIFLVKGANPPLQDIYNWLFANIPGFSLFRDSTKFFFLVALSYSVLIGITVEELGKRLSWKIENGRWKTIFVPLLLTSYFLLLIHPVWLSKMTGTFSEPMYKEEFLKAADILKKDDNFGRIFWIPSRASLGFASPAHPSAEAGRFISKRPFAIGIVGDYEVFNFLREAPFMGEIFKIAGIKYIAYPYPDTRREELNEDNVSYYNTFLDQLSNLPWIEKRLQEPPVTLLETKENKDRLFLVDNTYCVVGSDGIYSDLVSIENFDLSKNGLIFLEEKPGMGNMLKDTPCTYLMYDKEVIDLSATFIDQSKFIFPANYLSNSPSETKGSSGWWKRETSDFVWWRNFLQQKYSIDNLDFDFGGGWAVAEGSKELEVRSEKLETGNVLLVRVMRGKRGEKVAFYQGEDKIGEIITKIEIPEKVHLKLTGTINIPDQLFEYDKADFRWFEVGNLTDNGFLSIKAEGDINVVNSIAVVPENQWVSINESIDRYNIAQWSKLTVSQKQELFKVDNHTAISYEKLSPTHYKVKINEIKRPATLAFSETFDSLWQLEGRSSYSLYSIINGFYVEKDGDYDVYFSPQKYVLPGFIISGLTLVTCLLCIKFFERNRTS